VQGTLVESHLLLLVALPERSTALPLLLLAFL
jgi:hypothetical protein